MCVLVCLYPLSPSATLGTKATFALDTSVRCLNFRASVKEKCRSNSNSRVQRTVPTYSITGAGSRVTPYALEVAHRQCRPDKLSYWTLRVTLIILGTKATFALDTSVRCLNFRAAVKEKCRSNSNSRVQRTVPTYSITGAGSRVTPYALEVAHGQCRPDKLSY